MQLQVFNHKDLGQVRVIGDNENPLFCLRDICEVLGLESVNKVANAINAKKTYRDDTPMQTAIACGNIEAVLMLIQHGISIQKHELEYAQKDTTRNILSFMFKSMGIRA